MPYNDTDFKESNVNYLNKDFSDIKKSLIDYAKSYFPDTYRDFNEASPGMMLIEMSAYVGDVLSFYIDQQYKEMMLPLAEERKNIVNMAKMFGYKVKPIVPAYVDLIFSQDLTADVDNPSVIKYNTGQVYEKGIQVKSSTNEDIVFETLDVLDFTVTGSVIDGFNDLDEISDSDLDSGLATKYRAYRKIKAVSGETKTYNFDIGAPKKFLRLTLPETNVIDILSVKDSNNNKWYQVDYLAQDKVPIETHYTNDELRDNAYISILQGTQEVSSISVPYSLEYIRTEKRFMTEVNEDNTTSLVFGNGILKGNTIQNNYLSLEQTGITIPGQTTDLVDTLNPLLGDEYSTLGETPNATTLTVQYRIGGGINSNVGVGDLTTITTGESGIANVTNDFPARGGKDTESIEEIRQNTSANFTTQNRAVTKEDYESRILNMPAKFGGISKVYVARSNIDADTYSQPSGIQTQVGQINSALVQLESDFMNNPGPGTSGGMIYELIAYAVNMSAPGNPAVDAPVWANDGDPYFSGTDAIVLTSRIQGLIDNIRSSLDALTLASTANIATRFGTIDIYILGYDNNKNLVGNPHAADLGTSDGVTLLMEQNIKNYLSQYKILTDVVNIQDGYIINFGVEFDVIAHKYAHKTEVKLRCIEKIKEYFNIDKMQFNQPIYLSQLMYELLGVDGVRGVNFVKLVNQWSADELLYSYLYDSDAGGSMVSSGTTGYGYLYDFDLALQSGTDVIVPSNPLGTPAVFELKNPNKNIRGVVR